MTSNMDNIFCAVLYAISYSLLFTFTGFSSNGIMIQGSLKSFSVSLIVILFTTRLFLRLAVTPPAIAPKPPKRAPPQEPVLRRLL